MTPNAASASASRRRRRGRRGFTLVELMVVLLIIAFLAALLFPAIQAAIRAAKNAQVSTEINNLGQALSSFKNKYGDYPPSRIILNESGLYSATDPSLLTTNAQMKDYVYSSTTPVSYYAAASADVRVGQLYQRTLIAFRKFWPKLTLYPLPATNSPLSPTAGWYDFNGDGVMQANHPVLLQGHEALVFFLGGIPLPSVDSSGNFLGTYLGMTGFDKNPANPFTNSIQTTANPAYGPNRNPPFFDFAATRLAPGDAVYYGNENAALKIPRMPGYTDTLGSQGGLASKNFYAYFSTNCGAGYDPNDVNFVEPDTQGNAPTWLNMTANQPTYFFNGTAPAPALPQITPSPSPNPYTSGAPIVAGGGQANLVYLNAQSFQIISPGLDGSYGLGGAYNANGTTPLPTYTNNSTTTYTNSPEAGARAGERDNLTNFHNGRLD
jgi:prepilin-type N-terminal cleavage/methylation domain-containing protein